MEKTVTLVAFRLCVFLSILLVPNVSEAEPRSQTVQIICSTQPEHNATAFVPNFVATMETISDQMRTQGYGIALTGSGPDANYGIAQCYGDLSLLDCVLCYAEARTVLPQCFPFNGGRIYLDGCFMRAENYTFDHQYLGPEDTHVCGNRTRKNSLFQQTARQAVQQAVANAPKNNGYARAELAVPGATNETAYVLVDCWRTLSANSCRACLQNASASMMGCLPWSEGRALYTGCFLRYSDVNFLNAIATSEDSSPNVVVIVIAVVSAVVVFVLGAIIAFYMWKNKQIEKKRKGSNDVEKLVKTLNDSSLNFKYSTLEKATASFDEANKLGQGGFGTVYKGVLQDGREIAVKRLFFNNKHRAADFYNEVNIISSVEHKNLVRLLGCSCSGPESLLVYEFLPNQSLDRFIFDSTKGKTLNWEKRFDIIIGTAEGLVYLHENNRTRIIHRDIKASNILLDSRLRAKIADFGLARSFQEDKSHISTAIAGTLGYMAPEYLAHGQLTEKADVYSFGVLLLEIVTGRQNNRSKNTEYCDSLISITWQHFQHARVEELFDPNLMLHNYHTSNVKKEVVRVVHVGLLCTQEVAGLSETKMAELRGLKLEQRHGKSRVRVARVWRDRDGKHHFAEWSVNISLISDCLPAYVSGDNSDIVATDTMKNTVYAKAKECSEKLSAEDFAIVLAKHFTSFYQQVTAAIVNIVEKPWERISIKGQQHEHGFKLGSERHTTEVMVDKSGTLHLTSGIEGLSILKTTKSGFEGFIRDRYTMLPETRERMMATEVTASWRYSFESLSSLPLKPLYFTDRCIDVKEVLLNTFFGPSKEGVYSPSVQATLYEMAKAVLGRSPDISFIQLKMPNIHFLPVNLPSKDKPDIVKFADDVYLPTDEPHGTIQATLSRLTSKM